MEKQQKQVERRKGRIGKAHQREEEKKKKKKRVKNKVGGERGLYRRMATARTDKRWDDSLRKTPPRAN